MSGCTNCNNGGCGGCGALIVPEGPIGLTGPTGPTGPAGADGVDGVDGPTWMSWSWSRGSDLPHILSGGNATFKTAAEVIYPGTTVVPAPTYVLTETDGISATPNFDVQLYDATNSQILAQVLNQSNTSPAFNSLSVTSGNWPTGAARLQLRIRDNNAANDQIFLFGMTWHN